MSLSVKLVVTPTAEIANDLLKNVDEYFAKTKTLREIGWCSNYTFDKRFRSVYLIEIACFNVSPNRRIYKKPHEHPIGEQQYDFVPFPLCFCFNCRSMLECLYRKFKNLKEAIGFQILKFKEENFVSFGGCVA